MRSPCCSGAPISVQHQYAPGDEAGNLDNADVLTAGRGDDDAVALVDLACLVKIGADELARPVDDRLHRSGRRGSIDVAVKDIHENRNARQRRLAEAKFGRRHCLDKRLDAPVGRADDDAGIDGHRAERVAEEDHQPAGKDGKQPEGRHPDKTKNQRRHDGADDKGPALPMNRRDGLGDGPEDRHGGVLRRNERRLKR